MDSIEFLLIVGSFAVVLLWYLKNAAGNADGSAGLLALTVADCEKEGFGPRRSYRMRPRNAPPRGVRFRAENDAAKADSAATTYKIHDSNAKMRRRYRQQDETRYRVKDKAGAYREAKAPGAA